MKSLLLQAAGLAALLLVGSPVLGAPPIKPGAPIKPVPPIVKPLPPVKPVPPIVPLPLPPKPVPPVLPLPPKPFPPVKPLPPKPFPPKPLPPKPFPPKPWPPKPFPPKPFPPKPWPPKPFPPKPWPHPHHPHHPHWPHPPIIVVPPPVIVEPPIVVTPPPVIVDPTPVNPEVPPAFSLVCQQNSDTLQDLAGVSTTITLLANGDMSMNGVVGFTEEGAEDREFAALAKGKFMKEGIDLSVDQVGTLRLAPQQDANGKTFFQGELNLFGKQDNGNLACDVEKLN